MNTEAQAISFVHHSLFSESIEEKERDFSAHCLAKTNSYHWKQRVSESLGSTHTSQ